jgi:TIGR03009 family protein
MLNQVAPRPRQPQPSWGLLSQDDNASLEVVLKAWEERSAKVKTLKCTFQCFKYDKVFGAKGQNGAPPLPTRICKGEIRYAAPDKGHYHITEEVADPSKVPPVFEEKDGEHWVCDGNAVYELNYEKKQLIERRLPNELKGKAISNSPLPFVFGTTADKMRQRYWMRVRTPERFVGREIWLEVEPIYAEDRANYQRATVILDEKRMLPKAVSLELPNGNRTNYVFDDDPSINNPISKWVGVFDAPRTPSGWKRVVEDPPSPEPRAPEPRAASPRDASTLRGPRGVLRK